MLQDEDQDSRQILRPRSRPIPRPLQLQSCSINNNNKLSRIFISQLLFKTLHPLACGSKLHILWSYTLLHHYSSIRPRMCSTFEHCFPRSVSVSLVWCILVCDIFKINSLTMWHKIILGRTESVWFTNFAIVTTSRPYFYIVNMMFHDVNTSSLDIPVLKCYLRNNRLKFSINVKFPIKT